MSTKDKKKANKTLWESTFGEISRREIDSSDSEEEEQKKDAEIKSESASNASSDTED